VLIALAAGATMFTLASAWGTCIDIAEKMRASFPPR